MRKLNETIFYRWIEEVWNNGSEETIDDLFAEEGVADYPYHLEKNPIYGKEEYKGFIRFVRALFSNIQVTIEQIASDDNKVIAFCTFHATRRSVETNGLSVHSPVRASGLCQVIIENEKIIRAWSNIDLFETDEPRIIHHS